jgi:membrane protein implicated in regulation of membrane protease activity
MFSNDSHHKWVIHKAMKEIVRGLSYLLVLYFELALIVAAGVFGARYLNEHYPVGFNWMMLTAAISVALCIYLPYRFLVKLVKESRKKEDGE